MAAVGGSIQEVALSGRVFGVAADAEAQRKLGGLENEVMPNGDGMTARLVKTPWHGRSTASASRWTTAGEITNSCRAYRIRMLISLCPSSTPPEKSIRAQDRLRAKRRRRVSQRWRAFL